jgi:hypothetical protein
MRRLTLVSLALGSMLCLSGLPLFAQQCAVQCPGACLRNATSSEGTANVHYIGNKSPLEVLSTNTKLAARLQSLLPPGTNVKEAASGFKKLSQFVAALYASHDLGIPFDQLRSKMLGNGKASLSKAIQELSPDVNTKAEVKKVSKQTDADLTIS